MCFDDAVAQLRFLHMAHIKGMRAPHYVFIGYIDVPLPRTYKPWIMLGNLLPKQVEKWQQILREVNFKQVMSRLVEFSL